MLTYQNNLSFLEKYAPALFHTIKNEEPLHKPKLTEFDTSNNFYMEMEGKICFANSQYHEKEQFFEMFKDVKKDCQVLILVGIGNGNIINYVKENFSGIKAVFIVEPVLDIFRRYISRNRLQDVFVGMGEITFIVNRREEDSVSLILEMIHDKYMSVEIAGLPSYFSVLENWYTNFKYQMIKGIRTKISTFATLDISKYKWLRNTIYNLRVPHARQEAVSGLLKGKPAVIVSAGPSLNKHFHLLDELKDKAVMVAAGSAIKILNSKNIEPHFRMVIDAGNDTDLYDGKFYGSSANIPLLYANQAYEGILAKYEGDKIFMMLHTDILGKYIFNKLEIPYKYVDSGASVVHSAFSFLCQAGCNPIIFIGQDMCFYENELYAEGRASNKQQNYDPRGWIKQKDIYGNEVYTIRNYLQIKYDYEQLTKRYPDVRCINATEGGLGLEGVENKTLTSVMKEDIKDSAILNLKDEIEKICEAEHMDSEIIEGILNDIAIEVEKVEKINNERFERLRRLTISRENRKNIKRLWDELQYIDVQMEKQLSQIPIYNEVLRTLISLQAMALKKIHMQDNGELNERIIHGEKYLYGLASEVDIFCQLIKDWIEESKETKSANELNN